MKNLANLHSERFDTIGGLLFGLFGTEPKTGDELEYQGLKLKVEKHERNRIKQVRILALSNKIS